MYMLFYYSILIGLSSAHMLERVWMITPHRACWWRFYLHHRYRAGRWLAFPPTTAPQITQNSTAYSAVFCVLPSLCFVFKRPAFYYHRPMTRAATAKEACWFVLALCHACVPGSAGSCGYGYGRYTFCTVTATLPILPPTCFLISRDDAYSVLLDLVPQPPHTLYDYQRYRYPPCLPPFDYTNYQALLNAYTVPWDAGRPHLWCSIDRTLRVRLNIRSYGFICVMALPVTISVSGAVDGSTHTAWTDQLQCWTFRPHAG